MDKKLIAICAVMLGIGVAIGHVLSKDPPPQVKTVVQEVIKEHVVTQTRTIREPDGSVVVERVQTKDLGVTAKSEAVVTPTKTSNAPVWFISGDANIGLSGVPFYGAQVQHKFIGPISLGLRGTTEGTVGVVVGISF